MSLFCLGNYPYLTSDTMTKVNALRKAKQKFIHIRLIDDTLDNGRRAHRLLDRIVHVNRSRRDITSDLRFGP